MIYLIHFEKPYKHAKHYLGYCADSGLPNRLARHYLGNGARLLAVLIAAGIQWRLVRVWPNGTKADERRFKNQGAGTRFCPICKSNQSKYLIKTKSKILERYVSYEHTTPSRVELESVSTAAWIEF